MSHSTYLATANDSPYHPEWLLRCVTCSCCWFSVIVHMLKLPCGCRHITYPHRAICEQEQRYPGCCRAIPRCPYHSACVQSQDREKSWHHIISWPMQNRILRCGLETIAQVILTLSIYIGTQTGAWLLLQLPALMEHTQPESY